MTTAQTNNKKHFLTANSFRFFDFNALIQMLLWSIFCIVIVVLTVLFIIERTRINNFQNTPVAIDSINYTTINDIKNAISNGTISNNDVLTKAYKTMYGWAHYPLIDFSLMVGFFPSVPTTDPTSAWSIRSNAVDMAYSYMFITAVIAITALIFQIYLSALNIKQRYDQKKYGLSTQYPNDFLSYKLFSVKMLMDFVTNLAIVFAFFNFLATLVVIGYWILLYLIQIFVKKILKHDSGIVSTFQSNKSNFFYLIFVLLFQNLYTLLKAIFLTKLGVNLDLIFQIILPIGTITVIVGLFIKNMLDSKVNAVLKSIKTICGNVTSFRVFFYTQQVEALDDYTFVSILPPMIKNPLTAGTINKQEAYELMRKLDEGIKFVEEHYAHDVKQKNYILYTLFNNITHYEEIEEIKTNTLRIEQYKVLKVNK